jgi:NADPH:quinone reductase-like Zn-dependent oxidoreductase
VGREDTDAGMVGVLGLMIKGRLLSPFVQQRVFMFMARIRRNDLLFLAKLIEDGKLTPVIDRTYALADAAAAIRHLETGHARGKVIVTV